jgi:hypothetical protein
MSMPISAPGAPGAPGAPAAEPAPDASHDAFMLPLRGAVLRIAGRALALEARGQVSSDDMADLRVDAWGDLTDALDKMEPGFGTGLHLLLYPECDALLRGGDLGRKQAAVGGLSRSVIEEYRRCNGLDPATGKSLA